MNEFEISKFSSSYFLYSTLTADFVFSLKSKRVANKAYKFMSLKGTVVVVISDFYVRILRVLVISDVMAVTTV